jgi:hypothetical protein
MHLDVTKLDGRFTGYPYFRHRIYARYNGQRHTQAERLIAFGQMRKWFVQQFGDSCERDVYLYLKRDTWNRHRDTPEPELNDSWCWHPDLYLPCFYVADSTMNWINLKTHDQTISISSEATP